MAPVLRFLRSIPLSLSPHTTVTLPTVVPRKAKLAAIKRISSSLCHSTRSHNSIASRLTLRRRPSSSRTPTSLCTEPKGLVAVDTNSSPKPSIWPNPAHQAPGRGAQWVVQGEFLLHYQPIVSQSTGASENMEALGGDIGAGFRAATKLCFAIQHATRRKICIRGTSEKPARRSLNTAEHPRNCYSISIRLKRPSFAGDRLV